MKALALTLALLATPLVAQENPCDHAREVGALAMQTRQSGVPFEAPLTQWVYQIPGGNPWRERTLNVLIGAYSMPILPDEETKRRVVEAYANAIREECMKEFYGNPT